MGTSEYETFERRRREERGNTFRKLSMGGRHRLLEWVSSGGASGRRGDYKEHHVYLDKSNELVSCPTQKAKDRYSEKHLVIQELRYTERGSRVSNAVRGAPL